MNNKARDFWMNESKEVLIDHLFECIHNGEVLLARIDKAIEYITKYWISYEDIETINDLREELDIPIEDIKKVLDILKGSDSNE